jgi:hypothetical protein
MSFFNRGFKTGLKVLSIRNPQSAIRNPQSSILNPASHHFATASSIFATLIIGCDGTGRAKTT